MLVWSSESKKGISTIGLPLINRFFAQLIKFLLPAEELILFVRGAGINKLKSSYNDSTGKLPIYKLRTNFISLI